MGVTQLKPPRQGGRGKRKRLGMIPQLFGYLVSQVVGQVRSLALQQHGARRLG